MLTKKQKTSAPGENFFENAQKITIFGKNMGFLWKNGLF
jgi:hypothetical protein